jgi:hypothetical protein
MFFSIAHSRALKLHLTLLTNCLKWPLQMPLLRGQGEYDKFFQQWILSRIPASEVMGGGGSHAGHEGCDNSTDDDHSLERRLDEEDGEEQKQFIREQKPGDSTTFY